MRNSLFFHLLIPFLLGSAAPAFGQYGSDYDSRYDRHYRANQRVHGIRAGVNVSQLYSLENGLEYYPSSIAKYFIAYQVESSFLPFLDFGAGLEIYQNGSSDGDAAKVNLLYLALPLSLKINVLNFYGKMGAVGGLRLNATEYVNGDRVSTPSGKYNTWDSGLFLAAGIRLGVFFGEIRHTWGQALVTEDYRTRQVQIGGGILF